MKDMLGRTPALEAEEALSLVLDAIDTASIKETVNIPIDEASGRVLALDISSPEDIPGFARSTMDGFAVLASDTFGATETGPAYLEVSGEILMGEEPGTPLAPGHAMKIATGGMLPEGADAVLMLEHAQGPAGGILEAQKAVAPGENVIQRGEDMARGQEMLSRGTVMRPQDIAVLASAGITGIDVFKRPTVAIISTGDEIVPAGEIPLAPGHIRDSNSYLLAGLVKTAGAEPVRRGILPDDYDAICGAIRDSAGENSMVLISGGSSVGARDMTERAIANLGRILFHSVRLKPGKPFLAGTVAGKPVFGLPGHPRAVAVCFEIFIRPAIRKLSGESGSRFRSLPRTLLARLSKSVHSSGGRREMIDVVLAEREGVVWAEPVLGKSGLLRTMVHADGSICVPLGKPGYDAGDTVTVTLY